MRIVFPFLLILTSACVEDTRPRGDGSIIVDSSSDTRSGDTIVTDGGEFGYCPGYDPDPNACSEDTQCDCGSCSLGSVCGDVGCPSGCATDTDCTDGWCSTGCCSHCVASCPANPCAAGSRCDLDTGRCNLIPCDDPETPTECATNFRCVGGSCQRMGCETNTDCDCGTCAQARCYDRPGQCCPPLPG